MKLQYVRLSMWPFQYVPVPVSLSSYSFGDSTSQFITPALLMPALINTQSDGGRGKPGGTGSTQAVMRHFPSLSGGLVPLMGGEDRSLLLAATGLREGEGKLMAAWRDKGEDEERRGGIEVEREKQREREGQGDEREGGIEKDCLPV